MSSKVRPEDPKRGQSSFIKSAEFNYVIYYLKNADEDVLWHHFQTNSTGKICSDPISITILMLFPGL
jgi:hypothetical protein